MDPLIGGVVSHYKIVDRIGAGGMGVVYLAEDEQLHRQVALKFISPLTAADETNWRPAPRAGICLANGYKRPEFWRVPVVKDGKTLTFDEATALFRDATGRSGPATWTLGNYPAGAEALPVTGVSWYEASAYAAFAGKSLPTVYHWYW